MNIVRIQGNEEKRNGIYYEYDVDAKPLGEGGMGRVFKGFRVDERTGERQPVAIKAIYDNIPERVVERARREAAIRIDNENLIRMFGFIETVNYYEGRTKCKVYYHIIMELLVGVTLEDIINGVTSDPNGVQIPFAAELYAQYTHNKSAAIVKIMTHILCGLMALHDKGYIHRDIDPSNIMVTSDGHIKLIDFGIAKNLKALGSNDKLMTAAGKFIGKAEYASPELVLGDVRSQNYTTDIYALGILFYRLLVGRLPFNGSQYEVLQNQLKSKVPVGNIENKALANVIKKATEKIQNNRYGSIAEFRVAIDAAEKFKPGFWDKYGKYLIICFVALTIGSGVWYWTKPRPIPIDKFEYALNLLDSQIADSVKLGFDEMKILADNGNDKAKIEIGITSFANEKNTIISQRRALLNKGNTRLSSELDVTIKYLSSINDESVITPEVYYILGGAYFYQGDRVNALNSVSSFHM